MRIPLISCEATFTSCALLAERVRMPHIVLMDDTNIYPKTDPHNTARHWVAETSGAYVTQSDLRNQAPKVGVEHLFSAAKGIYKPAGSEYVFSIRHEPTGKYLDRDPDHSGKIWSIVYDAETDSRTGAYAPSSTSALMRCIGDKMPVAIFWRHEEGQSYENLGLGLPLEFSGGKFLIAGPYKDIGSVGTNNSTADLVLDDLSQTDALTTSLRRLEQHQLRLKLLQGEETGCCRLCGVRLPASLLVASHIKPRNLCSHEERLDPNIATLMCLLGCDSLYERGYLRVRDDGAIYRFNASGGDDLKAFMKRYEGRSLAFNSATERGYFRFHRELVFNA